MSASKTIPSRKSNSEVHTKRANPLPNVRATAHEILCSFAKVLTEREKIVLHALAQGMSADEIATRLQPPPRVGIDAGRKIRGGARSLSLLPGAGTGSTEEKISASRRNLTSVTESLTGDCAQDANAS